MIGFEFANPTEGTLYVWRGCSSVKLEHFSGNEWIIVKNVGNCLDNSATAYDIPPGDTHSGTVIASDRYSVWVSGVYRIRLSVSDEPGPYAGLLPAHLRVSNPFAVQVHN